MQDSITLYAPNGLPIVGLRTEDGGVISFTYSYDTRTKTRLYELQDGGSRTTSDLLAVDSDGNDWQATNVEYHTLFERRE